MAVVAAMAVMLLSVGLLPSQLLLLLLVVAVVMVVVMVVHVLLLMRLLPLLVVAAVSVVMPQPFLLRVSVRVAPMAAVLPLEGNVTCAV